MTRFTFYTLYSSTIDVTQCSSLPNLAELFYIVHSLHHFLMYTPQYCLIYSICINGTSYICNGHIIWRYKLNCKQKHLYFPGSSVLLITFNSSCFSLYFLVCLYHLKLFTDFLLLRSLPFRSCILFLFLYLCYGLCIMIFSINLILDQLISVLVSSILLPVFLHSLTL